MENGIRKADQYIPETVSSPALQFFPEPHQADLPDIEVTLKSESTVPEAGCTVSKVELKLRHQSFEIIHINYRGWPDHSIPSDFNQLIHLARVVSSANSQGTTQPTPVLCHCSAGVGRTGTFIAISSLLRASGHLPPAPRPEPQPLADLYSPPERSPLGALPRPGLGDDPVAREVDALREQRTTMVQRSEQLGITYQIMMNVLAADQSH